MQGIFIPLLLMLFWSCNKKNPGTGDSLLFTLMDENHTNIHFLNSVEYTEEFNTYTYRNFYNGAGVGIGDINNDELPDLYFCSNQSGNKLYLNKGNFKFEDITENAGVGCEGAWSTGVGMADINGDGWLDLFVCKSGKPGVPHRNNELFINNGDLTFTEKSREYGLADIGLSNHASFFDYDKDGDLDCYLLNNSFQSVTEFDIRQGQREIRDSLGANKLYRNDGRYFTDVTAAAGIYGSKIGFGLGVSVSDINRDDWPDIYVSNDFFERDYLYINNKDGTFSEQLEQQMREISLGAMGADIADINNDGWPEIFATEMTPEGNSRLKTKAVFEDWQRYQMKVDRGYYHQFARNVLQLNNGDGSFSEIGRYSGVSATDWSWGALIMDLDNDGWKDIFVANGIYKDLLDRDFLDFYSDPTMMRALIRTEEQAILKVIDMIPSVRIPNYAFHNNHDLTFTNMSAGWGLGTPSFSNGAAYGDLDNDGDLDIVVNNVNMAPFIYRNGSGESMGHNHLSITLKGTGKNTAVIGAEVTTYCGDTLYYQELYPQRGFKSSMDPRIHIGLGNNNHIDSLVVLWPGGRSSILKNFPANQFIVVNENESGDRVWYPNVRPPGIFSEQSVDIDYIHQENDFVDFERDRLLFHMMSNTGPRMAVADINSDGWQDFYTCGAKGFPGSLYVQDKNGKFTRTNIPLFDGDKTSEDTDCTFFDADGDGDADLYVTSGGNEFPPSSSALRDRLYINNGKGIFSRSDQTLPGPAYESSSCVEQADFDLDGDIDLFVGIRFIPFAYGLPVNGYLLENDGKGKFRNVADTKAPALKNMGMITSMKWTDVDNDGDQDMIVAGDWMPVKVLINEKGDFTDKSDAFGLANTEGWWNTIEPCDLNGDGYTDFIAGNHGLNSFFQASIDRPVIMYVNDFDMNGKVEQLICGYNNDKSYPVAMKDDLVRQIPSLAGKYKKYDDYKDQTIQDMFSPEVLNRSVVLSARILQSCAFINSGGSSFIMVPLPAEAQFSPVYAIHTDDFDNDGFCDILIGGNQYMSKPETGIYDAGNGLFLKGIGNNQWKTVPASESGIFVKGQIRDICPVQVKSKTMILFGRNSDSLKFYKY